MGQYAKKARYHEEQIRYYHTTADENGYKQAEGHLSALYELKAGADRSKNSKIDVVTISEIIKSVHPLMAEMKDKMQKQKTP
jgi:hypothetical protein